MTKQLESDTGDIAADLAALRKDVAHLAESMGKLLQHQTHAAGLHVSESIGDARDKIVSTTADAQKRVRVASGEVEASIERNPVTAVLIAFGIGISLGILSRLRG